MAQPYEVNFTRQAYEHLKAFARNDRNVILDAVSEQLRYEPATGTRNRKLLRQNRIADWELRVGQYRVFYDVETAAKTVRVLAVAVKRGNRLSIGGTEITL